jgi:hypothetical protein
MFSVERYPTVLQMTSTITATRRDGVGLAEIFTALFPCGSVTGAPKVQTMRHIAALEKSSRGVYCGAVGIVYPGGDATFNVGIRTLVRDSETGMAEYGVGPRKRPVYVAPHDLERIAHWEAEGFTEAMRTPDNTLIFVTPEKSREIVKDQVDCMGCLSTCRFSNWSQHEPDFDNGRRADPRSFCIQKTLQDVSHDGALEKNLMFAGHNAYRFGSDPFYSNGFIPGAKQLVERILTGR